MDNKNTNNPNNPDSYFYVDPNQLELPALEPRNKKEEYQNWFWKSRAYNRFPNGTFPGYDEVLDYYVAPPPVTERNGWTWGKLVATCPFKVEQETFPEKNSGHTLQGPTPCTDGETLWVPKGSFDTSVSYLFHEWAHAELHYPDGPDAGLLDPLPRNKSIWEWEACMVAMQVIEHLGLVDTYNSTYLRFWDGNYGAVDLRKVAAATDAIIIHTQREE